MYFLSDLCSLCLAFNKNVRSQNSVDSSIQEILECIIPEYVLQESSIPKQICKKCLKNLDNISKFRQKCRENITTFNEHVQKLKQENGANKYLSVTLNGIRPQRTCETFTDHVKNIENATEKPNSEMDLESEIFDNSSTENQSECIEKPEHVKIKNENTIDNCFVKKEIVEESIMNEDPCSSKNDLQDNCSEKTSEHSQNMEAVFIKEEMQDEYEEENQDEYLSGNCTASDFINQNETAAETTLQSLPRKSRTIYEKRYEEFIQWCEIHEVKEYSENVLLAYFSDQAKILQAPSLWSVFSMLKATLSVKNNVEIKHFNKLIAFLKNKRAGYQPKKSKTLNPDEITRFLKEAPDEKFLMMKVALIFGICGACRRHELYNLRPGNIRETNDILIITIPDTKTKRPRTFTVINDEGSDIDYLGLYQKYSALRANKSAGRNRFFLQYVAGRCTDQVVGINTFGNIPKMIATYLNLEDPHLYTGHCFRRSSATLLANKRDMEGVNPLMWRKVI